MVHANASLSELGRLMLARVHVESGSTIRAYVERFQVSTTAVIRRSQRHQAVLASGRTPSSWDMADVSSGPRPGRGSGWWARSSTCAASGGWVLSRLAGGWGPRLERAPDPGP